MEGIGLYRWMGKVRWMGFRAKVMSMAFLGTHVPLIGLAIYFAVSAGGDLAHVLTTLGVTLVATLLGTGVTLFVLNALLRPLFLSSRALRLYRDERIVPDLPTEFTDEVGVLMNDVQQTVTDLEQAMVLLRNNDAATGVLNRAGLIDAMENTTEPYLCLALVRVGNLAEVAAGLDQSIAIHLLRDIIARLNERLGKSLPIGRVADGDLAVLLPLESDADKQLDDTSFALRTLLSTISRPIEVRGIRITPVLGAGLAVHRRGENPELALDNATTAVTSTSDAMPVAAHTEVLRGKVRERFILEQDLRAALQRDEFQLHFQPVMDTGLMRPAGAEALIRWNSPERGMVSPGVFIPVAEASGLIEPIGLWVLREACRQVATWPGNMRVAINLGARQFMDEDLAWHVDEAIRSAEISPDRLEIELTESVAMVDHEHTRRTFGQLRDMGVHIAIDDFGTGYASMSTLRKLPFSKLKIDREFVTDVHKRQGSQAICKALIALGQGLDLNVLAEGTESLDEVNYLNGLGCTLFQGYYFSRPVPASGLMAAFEKLRAGDEGLKAAV